MFKKSVWKESLLSLKSTKTLALSAMLIALTCALRLLVIPISSTINVTLFFLPSSVGGMLLGPVAACIIGGGADIISYFINPTGPFFPGFTVNAMICGIVYGMFFYRCKPSLKNIIPARLILSAIIDFGLTPLWLHILYSAPFAVLYTERAVKCAILFPIETILLYTVNSAVYGIFSPKKEKKRL